MILSDREPRVSVITATYNRALPLHGAIASVLRQDLGELEHIIIDDGSTDDTASVVASFLQDGRIRYHHTASRGQPAALNLGLRRARAPLVAFLDSDDELMPNHLSMLADELWAGDYDFLLASFETIICGDNTNPTVTDFYRPERRISVGEIDCITGALFGRRQTFLELGGFRQTDFADTELFERLKAGGYGWKRVLWPTYRYFFGRCDDSLAMAQTRTRSCCF